MLGSVYTLFLSIICLGLLFTESDSSECEDTKFIVSKCFEANQYQWLIEVPKTSSSCAGQSIADPRRVPCNFACERGQAVDPRSIACEKCPPGQYSIGSGRQYLFDDSIDLHNITEITVKAMPLVNNQKTSCDKNELWHVKNDALQGDVRLNCALEMSINFKLEHSGSVTIIYNLPTSFALASIKSRCSFDIGTDSKYDVNSDTDEMQRRVQIALPSSGYGTWKTRSVTIPDPGEYILTVYAIGMSSFHFPLSIKSITIEGSSYIAQCIDCPAGTYANEDGSESCKPCSNGTYASETRSTQCIPCDNSDFYADENGKNCRKRPTCLPSDYKKVLGACDKNNQAKFEYEPKQPKICKDYSDPPKTTETITCRTCNPGTFKNETTGSCDFCPEKTYSNGSLSVCLPCPNDLSLVPGLYYVNWNEFPKYLSRKFLSFDDSIASSQYLDSQSWIPSIAYISAQPLADALSLLSLNVAKGFRQTDVAKISKVYGTLYFKFSIKCTEICMLSLVSQSNYDDDFDEWNIIHKWHFNHTDDHENILQYTYSVPYSDPATFSWLFATDSIDPRNDEIRIYEIRVTNTILGGSDRCVACLTDNNQETECKSCSAGHILSQNTCIRCSSSSISTRQHTTDLVPNVCQECRNNTITDDSVSCYVPCKQNFSGNIPYDLSNMSTISFHGSKLFTQKGSGYFHVFNASICGKTSVTCVKTLMSTEKKQSSSQMSIESKLCRLGVVPDENENSTSIAYIDDFGEELINVSLSTSKMFPAFRSDYELTDITLVYRVNTTNSQSVCSERITYLSLRCDHSINEANNQSTDNYLLQTPNNCATGTCDGCTFYFLLRTPLACPICDENIYGFREFDGPCHFGWQEIRRIPYPYCKHVLKEKTELHRCSFFTIELQIIIAVFIIVAMILISVVLLCWRKNRRLEYRYMQLVENVNPDDDTPVDNVCAQISEEEESEDEIHFKAPSKARKMLNTIRNTFRSRSTNDRSDAFTRDSMLLTTTMGNNEA